MIVLNILKKSFLIPKCVLKIKNWQVALSYYLGDKNKEQEIILRDDTKCIMRNKSDAIAFFENFVLEVNTAKKNFAIKQTDIIIDIGAHVGYFTLYAAKRASNGKILSFEPTKESFSILKKNIEINNFQNTIIENVGVTKVAKKTILFVDNKYSIANTLYNNGKNLEKEEIQTTTLHDICEKYDLKKIDFLKMDCEGAEFEIILNTPPEVLKKIQKITAEIHEEMVPHKIEELIILLEKNGFTVNVKNTINGIKMMLPQLFAWK